MKKVGETISLRIYGPYRDKRVKGKWMVNVVDTSRKKDYKVVGYGKDTHAILAKVRTALLARLALR